MRLTEGLMIETGTYTPPSLRSFTSHLTNDVIYQFEEITHGGRNLTSANLAGIAGSIIQPSAQPNGRVAIANGWEERRIRFMLKFFNEMGFGSGLYEIVTGYTDHLGVIAHSGAVDPNMRMFFNNSIMARTVTEQTPYGQHNRMMLNDASHILANPVPNAPTYSMRPEDVVGSMSLQSAIDANLSHDITDTRAQFIGSGAVKKSRRDNATPPSYVSSIMKGLTTAFEGSKIGGDSVETYDRARGNMADLTVSKDPFLFKLIKETNYSFNGYITYFEFCKLFPNADIDIQMLFRGETRASNMPDIVAGNSEYWHVSTVEARVATTISYAVPAIMMDLMLTDLDFVATNETLNGQPVIQIRNVNSFAKGIDLAPYLDSFIERMRIEILSDIFLNNTMTYTLEVRVDIVGDTLIRIGINGQNKVDFITPSFCDALMAPVLTNNHLTLQNIAADLSSLYHHSDAHPDIHRHSAAPGAYARPPTASSINAPPANDTSFLLPPHMRR